MPINEAIHTHAEIHNNLRLAQYGLVKISAAIASIKIPEDIDQCFEATAEFLEIVTMVKAAVDSSIGITAASNVSPTLPPPPVTQRSVR
jgi:hypothetical protein